MTTKQFVLQLVIFLLISQLVALAVYYIWDERIFIVMIFASIGAMMGSWLQQRRKGKTSGSGGVPPEPGD